MSDVTWYAPLQFKVVGNFLQIINKKETFRFNDMIRGNARNKYRFVPVSHCSDRWADNILDDYTLNYGNVVPIKHKNIDGTVTEPVYGDVELLAEDTGVNGGVVVSVLSNTPTLLIGDAVQEFKGVFIINSVTNAVIAYCILPETVDVTEYLVFSYQGYLLEINNNVKVLDSSIETDTYSISATSSGTPDITVSSSSAPTGSEYIVVDNNEEELDEEIEVTSDSSAPETDDKITVVDDNDDGYPDITITEEED